MLEYELQFNVAVESAVTSSALGTPTVPPPSPPIKSMLSEPHGFVVEQYCPAKGYMADEYAVIVVVPPLTAFTSPGEELPVPIVATPVWLLDQSDRLVKSYCAPPEIVAKEWTCTLWFG